MKTSIYSKCIIFSFIFFLFLIFSCETKSSKEIYPYYEGFSYYLEDTFKIRNNNVIYYIIPLNSCDNCTQLNLTLLNNLPRKKIQIIFTGKSYKKNIKKLVSAIKLKYNDILYDENEKIIQYETGISKPLIVNIKNGKCVFKLEVSDFKLNEASKFLDSI